MIGINASKSIIIINELNDPRLQLKFKEYTENNYEDTYRISYADGIRYVFNE
jgi:hypothetical protein